MEPAGDDDRIRPQLAGRILQHLHHFAPGRPRDLRGEFAERANHFDQVLVSGTAIRYLAPQPGSGDPGRDALPGVDL